MKNKVLALKKEHLKLINFILLDKRDDGIVIPYNGLFGGGHVLDDIATILGWLDKAIPNSENSSYGRAFDDETERKMMSYYEFVKGNLNEIEELIHQSVGRFKVTEGIYLKDMYEGVWRRAVGPSFVKYAFDVVKDWFKR